MARRFLDKFPVLRSSDLDFARARLFEVFGVNRFELPDGPEGFAAHVNHLQLTGIGASYFEYGCTAIVGVPGASFVRQLFSLDGTATTITAGGHSQTISGASWSSVIPPDTPFIAHFAPGYHHLVLRIEQAALLRILASILGEEPDRPLEFSAESHANAPAMGRLSRRVLEFATEFNARSSYFSHLATLEVERMIIVSFLFCHRHSYTDLLVRDPIPTSRSPVRMVEEYIEAHWNEPLDLEALAKLANVGLRSLFSQFHKERGYGPAAFAKRIRLQKALQMLEDPSEQTTVTQVALKCGFNNLGTFAHDFRLQFGQTPSQALANGRAGE